MKCHEAIDLISKVTYKPGFVIEAFDHTDRFESAIKVVIKYRAPNYNREHAPTYSVPADNPSASFIVLCGACPDGPALLRQLLDVLLTIEQHEAREALRVGPDWEAPFHPHTLDGMTRWGDTYKDLTFGAV